MNQSMAPTTGRLRRMLRVALWGIAILFVGIALTPAIFQALSIDLSKPQNMTRELQIVEWAWFAAIGLFFSIWLFFVGGCVASFLNVVAWRLPQKRSILGGSACPNCGQGLTLRENMPIVGFLYQEGLSKCCQLPIPSRYFWVEVTLGTLFVLLGVLEIGYLGVNLPKWFAREPGSYYQINSLVLGVLIGHLTLVSLLFTFSLFRFDGATIPRSLLIVGIVVFGMRQLALANPDWFGIFFVARKYPWELVAVHWCLSIGGALVLGPLIGFWERWWLAPGCTEPRRELTFSFLLIGLLGEIDLMLLVAATYLFLSLPLIYLRQAGRGVGWMAPSHRLLMATVLHLAVWRQLNFGDLPNRILELIKG